MTSRQLNENKHPAIEQIYPDYSRKELAEAEDTVKRYVNLVWRIYKRLRSERSKNLTKEVLNARFKRPRF